MISQVNLAVVTLASAAFFYAYRDKSNSKVEKSQQTTRVSSFRWVQPMVMLILSFSVLGPFIIDKAYFPTLANSSWVLTLLASAFAITGTVVIYFSKRSLGSNFSHCAVAEIPESLTTKGLYSIMRHPIYTGNLLFLIGLTLFSNLNILAILSTLITYFYYRRSISYEEKDLSNKFPEYKDYSSRVNPLFPNIISMIVAVQKLEHQGDIEIRTITEDDEIERFASEFYRYSEVNLPRFYFRQCLVRGVYQGTDLIGGYAIAYGNSIGWPKKVAYTPSFLTDASIQTMSEINGAWILPEYSNKSAVSGMMWTQCILDATRDTKIVTFMAPTYKKGLIKLYERISNGAFYNDKLVTHPHPNVKIYWASSAKLRVLALTQIISRTSSRWRRKIL